MKRRLSLFYEKLYRHFGPQHWWPAQTPFEVIVGAILTQNTNWRNVERSIENLKIRGLLSAKKLYRLPLKELALEIRPSGYFNIKAARLKAFLEFFFREYAGSTKKMSGAGTRKLRRQLLSVKGIGPETADSILLYALDKPAFVVDAYTKRVLCRHGIAAATAGYDQLQGVFIKNLPRRIKLFNEYHALIVRLGKEFCLKNNPRCDTCPLNTKKGQSGG